MGAIRLSALLETLERSAHAAIQADIDPPAYTSFGSQVYEIQSEFAQVQIELAALKDELMEDAPSQF